MEMKNIFVELEQFEELTPEVLEEVNGGGFLKIFTIATSTPRAKIVF